MSQRNASFIRITPEFGFNRYDLSHWRFTQDDVCLIFIGGGREILTGTERENFRNWLEGAAAAAPETYQHSLFGAARDD